MDTLIPTKTRVLPTQIASDTFVIHDHVGEGHAPVLVPLNAMVIRSAEPVVVDTGMAENRDQFLADVFSLVEPEDIRRLVLGILGPIPATGASGTVPRRFPSWNRPRSA